MERHTLTSGIVGSALRAIGAAFFGFFVLATDADAARFTLAWVDNSTNETGFKVERSSNGSTFVEIATVGANVVSYVDQGLQNSTTYWYRIRAYNTAGNSAYSNVATGTTPPLLSNSAPVITPIADRALNADSSTGAIPFAVSDLETPAAGLAATVTSSNTTLVPVSRVVLGGSGANRTVTVTPAAGRSGTATVTISVSDGALSSSASFTVVVNAASPGLSIATQPQSTTLAPGSALTLSVVAATSGAASYQWFFNEKAIPGATGASYSIPLAQRFDAGVYHVNVTAGGVSVTSRSTVVDAGSVSSTGKLVNFSARAAVGTGANVLIPGFVVTGPESKRVLLRAVGPTLSEYGVSGTLANPQLELKRDTQTIASNADWSEGALASVLQQTFVQVGAFPLSVGSGDAALLLDLAPGSYTVTVADESGKRTGNALVEFYDADLQEGSTRMTNLSTRGVLGVGDQALTTGFVVEDGPVTLLIRTVGPGLAPYGVTGAATNPHMTLRRSVNGVSETIAFNDDWSDLSDAAYTEQVSRQMGAFPLAVGSRDAAFVVTLPAGIYTVGAGNAGSMTGVGLVEVYRVP